MLQFEPKENMQDADSAINLMRSDASKRAGQSSTVSNNHLASNESINSEQIIAPKRRARPQTGKREKHSIIQDLANANKSRHAHQHSDLMLMKNNQFQKLGKQNDQLSSSDNEFEDLEIQDLDSENSAEESKFENALQSARNLKIPKQRQAETDISPTLKYPILSKKRLSYVEKRNENDF